MGIANDYHLLWATMSVIISHQGGTRYFNGMSEKKRRKNAALIL
jgi:hypothetical protein